MITTRQSYVIGQSVLDAEDLYNLSENEDTVIGIAELDSLHEKIIFDSRRVSSFVELLSVDDFDAVDQGDAVGEGRALFVSLRAFEDEATVIGEGSMSYIIGWLPDSTDISGSSTIGSANLAVENNLESLVVGQANIVSRDDWISPSNAYDVVGHAQIIDKDFYRAVDRRTVIGESAISAIEGARYDLRSPGISGESFSGSPTTAEFTLDTSPLDEPTITLGKKYYLNTDTPDFGTVIGEAINKGTWDEEFTLEGLAFIDAVISKGHEDPGQVAGASLVSARFIRDTRFDFYVAPAPVDSTTQEFCLSFDSTTLVSLPPTTNDFVLLGNAQSEGWSISSITGSGLGPYIVVVEGPSIDDVTLGISINTATIGLSGDGVAVGEAIVGDLTNPFITNSPETTTRFSAFKYEISALELYNESYDLAGFIKARASVFSPMDIAMGTLSINGSASAELSDEQFFTVSTRYAGGFTSVEGTGGPPSAPDHYTEIPSPVDGEYVYDESLDKYYVFAAGTSNWAETNVPPGIYGTGQYS